MSFKQNVIPSRTLSEISEVETVRVGLDLVSAARRNIRFFRAVNECRWLCQEPVIIEAIRRYDQLWMPLVSDLTVDSKPPTILPPIDVEWVWFCHTLNPVSYSEYCQSRFSKLLGRPVIFDEDNEDYALKRCHNLWAKSYPDERFENEADLGAPIPDVTNLELFRQVKRHESLYLKFSSAYVPEIVYLIAARQRYKGFLLMFQKFRDTCSCFVPTLDIYLMSITHQSYPTIYFEDLKEIWSDLGRLSYSWADAESKDAERTKELWEKIFHQPYEKAGSELALPRASFNSPFYWVVCDADVNTKYKSMLPRFLLEVCLLTRLSSEISKLQTDTKCNFLRVRVARCHRDLKLDEPISSFCFDKWHRTSHLICEFGTRGLILELCRKRGSCFRSRIIESVTLLWKDLLRAESLALSRLVAQQLRVVTSITPPVQATYLLKCVPDKTTDDSGAMISDLILRSNNYRPQEGRWLSRTVLDHMGRECFVVRIRIGSGFWRRGAEKPSVVKWEDRITEIREGSWSYIASSVGTAPVKIAGTAKPTEPPHGWQAAWQFSTGDELFLRWDPEVDFCLRSQACSDSSATLLLGRRMEFQRKGSGQRKADEEQKCNKRDSSFDDEEGCFVTLVRFSEENPCGKATALLNYKLLTIDFSPEEDAVFMLLLCISLLRSMSEMRKEDIGNLLIRRRLKEVKPGKRDWGSVMIHESACSNLSTKLHLEPWYWNAGAVVMPERGESLTRQPVMHDSLAEGGDYLYRQAVLKI